MLLEQLSLGLHWRFWFLPTWVVIPAAALAVFIAVRLYKRSWMTVSKTGRRLVVVTLAIGAAHIIVDVSYFVFVSGPSLPIVVWKEIVFRPLLEDVMLASAASAFLIWIFRSSAEIATPVQDDTLREALVWQLECPTCNSVYQVGRDSVIVTMESVHSAAAFSVKVGKGNQPDLVGPRKIEADEQANVESTIRQVQHDLERGRRRRWWCNRCGNKDNPHDYVWPETQTAVVD